MAHGTRPIMWVLLTEGMCIALVSVFVWLWCPPLAASVLLGGLLFYIPNTYFTLYAFRYTGYPMGTWVVQSFYWGQSGKLALSAVGFAIVFRFVQPLNVGILFSAFFLMIVVHIFVATRLCSQMQQSSLPQKSGRDI